MVNYTYIEYLWRSEFEIDLSHLLRRLLCYLNINQCKFKYYKSESCVFRRRIGSEINTCGFSVHIEPITSSANQTSRTKSSSSLNVSYKFQSVLYVYLPVFLINQDTSKLLKNFDR